MKANISNLTWYLVCRTAVITILLGGAAVLSVQGSVQSNVLSPLFVLIGIAYAEALVSAVFLRKITHYSFFAQLQIAWDLLFITALILLTGGVESVFSFAYLLVIVSTGFLLSRRVTVLTAAAAVILFGGALNLQLFSYLESLKLYRTVSDGTFFSTLFVHSVAFFLTAILSGTLAERWRKSEEQLQKKSFDYEELEKMNQTILSHINSGLMLIGPDGKIRSFNRAAVEISGFLFQDVHGQALEKFFPGLIRALSPPGHQGSRLESSFQKKNGERIILGYAKTPARDSRGRDLGSLVIFQDLTHYKKIEDDLKRADRLAAVGRLAAAMAHEIRNPLASISGSVQMLLENNQIQVEDRHLMNIVVDEAERLNTLLSDFLNFARPKPPLREKVDLSRLLDELLDLIAADSRFSEIQLIKDYPDHLMVLIDPQQIRQSLWNLAVNAVEAIEKKGKIRFRVEMDQPYRIVVEDDGPGIADELVSQIFEPFFSTKDKGTGLGLATVHAVLKAHGGSVTAERSEWGGARFVLCLPDEER